MRALDYSVSRPDPQCLYNAGYRAVMRYVWTSYSRTDSRWPGKLLTKSEADQLRSAGLDIVSNFESWTGRAREGSAAGVEDALAAVAVTVSAGGPIRPVIYFSVDEDVAGSSVASYFKGVAATIGLARTGAYGSYRVIKYLFDNKLITYGWQTYAWSYGQWDSRAQIRQVHNGVTVCGADCDIDEIHADQYGGWREVEDVTAKDVWNYDPGDTSGIENRPWRNDAATNKTVAPSYAVEDMWDHVHRIEEKTDALAALVAGLSTAGLTAEQVVTELRRQIGL